MDPYPEPRDHAYLDSQRVDVDLYPDTQNDAGSCGSGTFIRYETDMSVR